MPIKKLELLMDLTRPPANHIPQFKRDNDNIIYN